MKATPEGTKARDGGTSAPTARSVFHRRKPNATIGDVALERPNGRLTQRESATFTRWKSLVQIQYRPPYRLRSLFEVRIQDLKGLFHW